MPVDEDVTPDDDVVLVEGVPLIADVALVHGVAVETGADGLALKMSGSGLRPPAPSSVEPIGIPTRPTDDSEPIPVGDEADADGPPKEVLAVVAHVPDAVPAVPPPSNTAVEVDDVALDVSPTFVPDVVPVELGGVPKDACGSEPPMPEHKLVVVGTCGDVPDVIELTPGDASSVAPRGMPAGATDAPGPIPSGDVMPSAPVCALAEPQPNRAATAIVIANRVIG